MSDIKILIATHKETYVPQNPLLFPIQVGSALSAKRLPGMLHDDDGINISERNNSYCELTAQYWAWKNLNADYYGFFHYRRYMSFAKVYPLEDGQKKVRRCIPYVEQASIQDDLSCYRLDEANMREVIEANDVVTVLSEHMDVTAYEQFCQFHNRQLFDLALKITYELHPEFRDAAKQYLSSKYIYSLNMFIMKKECFHAYAQWLFPILEEFEKQADFHNLNEAETRITGYIAERLFGIYYTWLKQQPGTRCSELQHVIFQDTEPVPQIHPLTNNEQPVVSIVTAASQLFVPYLGVLFLSLAEQSDRARTYDVIVLHTKLTTADQKQLSRISEGFPNISIRFANVRSLMQHEHLSVQENLSVETYYRYLIPELLPGYEKVLWMDADVLVKADIAKLYDLDLTGNCLAAAYDLDFIGGYKSDADLKKYADKQMHLRQPLSYFQAGVLVLNLAEIRRHYSAKDFINKTNEYNWRMMDQDVLNIFFEGKVTYFPQKWNVVMNWESYGKSRFDIMQHAPLPLWKEYLEARQDPAVIHYAGAVKPWKVPDCDYACDFWDCARRSPFYEEILYMNTGNTAYDPRKKTDTHREFQFGKTRLKIRIDMKKINRLMPVGSIRRKLVRNVVKKIM